MPADAANPEPVPQETKAKQAIPSDAGSAPPERERYHTRQLLAHWSIVFLVAMQFLMNKGMQEGYWASVELGSLVVTGGMITHAFGGSLILAIMLYRLWLRRTHGAPPPPRSLSPILQKVSRWNHYAFYGLLIGMPIFGMLALVVLWGPLGIAHALASYLLLALIAAHLAGAVFHAWKKDGVIGRIAQPDPASGAQAGVTPEA